jgi:type I restriction enzyme R subunit
MNSRHSEPNTIEPYVIEQIKKAGWTYVPSAQLHRTTDNVIDERLLTEAIIRLNPDIAREPENADEIIHKVRAAIISQSSDGLITANETLMKLIYGEHSFPVGVDNEHVTIKLIDFDDPDRTKNSYSVTNQFVVTNGSIEKRPDIVMLINGIPVVVGEIKTAFREAVTWFDGAYDITEDYQQTIPELFVPNVFCFATEGKNYRYGAVGNSPDKWAPWRVSSQEKLMTNLKDIDAPIAQMLNPEAVLDIMQYFTLFATDSKGQKTKIICRAQQYYAANKMFQRVKEGKTKQGLIWHFQGSGKSLLIAFIAQKLRQEESLNNPTVIVVVDRKDLDSQITGTFKATDIPNMEQVEDKEHLQRLLAAGTRKILVTTIQKFADFDGVVDRRDNIIMLVDEAHRTQEGNLALKMRSALPNAFLFGLTGTPINKRDRNTFNAFGTSIDEGGYLDKYSIEDSLQDKTTVPLHFLPRLVKLHIDRATIDEEFAKMADSLDEEAMEELSRRAGNMPTIVRSSERIYKIAEDVAKHYLENIEPNGFKAMLVCYDRNCCAEYKRAMDTLFPEDATDVVMTTQKGDPAEYKKWDRKKEDENKLLDRFRDPDDPLKILIVTSKLLTGFDAPIMQAMYLDKPMKGHTLLQAICRINRPYTNKYHGIIVDYIGVFDEVAKALNFDDKSVERVATVLDELRDEFPVALQKCMEYFVGVDRTLTGFDALIAAQECLPNNEVRDRFAVDYNYLAQLWEILSPDPMLSTYKDDYKWLSQIYESVQPSGGVGRLIWHALGSKTIEIVNENVHIETIRDDLETLVLDEEVVRDLLENPDDQKIKELEIKICARLRRHKNHPKFKQLGERLEELKQKYEEGFFNSLEFLKRLLEIARETVQAERDVESEDSRKQAKAALTELFQSVKTEKTPVAVENLVTEIDKLVNVVRFDRWQWSIRGTREVKIALRKALMKQQLHKDNELFDKAYSYIREYY